MTRRAGDVLRAGWLALVVAIVATGAGAIAASHAGAASTGSASAGASGRLPAELEPEVEFACLDSSGAFVYGNLSAAAREDDGRLIGSIGTVRNAVAAPQRPEAGLAIVTAAPRPDATPTQRDRVQREFQDCLDRTRFDPPASAADQGALLRLFQYQVSAYWPCLRAHGAHPGRVPTLGDYLVASEVPRLVPFQSGFQGSTRHALAAARACVFEPGYVRAGG